MSIKLDEKTKSYTVSYSKRHPITRVPHSRRRKGIKTKAEASRVFTQLVIEVESLLKTTMIPTWESLVKEYIQDFRTRDVSVKSVETYWLCLKAHTFGDWSNRLVDTITTLEIREIIKSKVGHRSTSHQKNLLKYIRGAFNFAVEKGYLNRDPVPKMSFKINDKLKSYLTEEQVRKLLTQARIHDVEWYPIWAMALYTGMRNGELYALTWENVNFKDKRLLVNSSWNNKSGFKDTKSGDDRYVDIADELMIILKKLKLKSFESPFVLPRIDKWDKGEQARELRMFLQGIGLPRIRFHDLRATWATIMLSKGVPPIKVMAMGGWRDLKTMEYYVRLAGVDITGIADNLKLHTPDNEATILKLC